MNLVTVNIKKPLYGTYCYIRSEIVDGAIRSGSKMEVILPKGKSIEDPVEWKKTGKVMKKVFKFPDNPMILYGNYVKLQNIPEGKVVEVEKTNQLNLLLSI